MSVKCAEYSYRRIEFAFKCNRVKELNLKKLNFVYSFKKTKFKDRGLLIIVESYGYPIKASY